VIDEFLWHWIAKGLLGLAKHAENFAAGSESIPEQAKGQINEAIDILENLINVDDCRKKGINVR
jgi:hypothetical protein